MVSATALPPNMGLTAPGWSKYELRTRSHVCPPPCVSPFETDKNFPRGQRHGGHFLQGPAFRDSGFGDSITSSISSYSLPSTESRSTSSSASSCNSSQGICAACYTVSSRLSLATTSSGSSHFCDQCIKHHRNVSAYPYFVFFPHYL